MDMKKGMSNIWVLVMVIILALAMFSQVVNAWDPTKQSFLADTPWQIQASKIDIPVISMIFKEIFRQLLPNTRVFIKDIRILDANDNDFELIAVRKTYSPHLEIATENTPLFEIINVNKNNLHTIDGKKAIKVEFNYKTCDNDPGHNTCALEFFDDRIKTTDPIYVEVLAYNVPKIQDFTHGDTHYHSDWSNSNYGGVIGEIGGRFSDTIEVSDALGIDWFISTDHTGLNSGIEGPLAPDGSFIHTNWESYKFDCSQYDQCLIGEEINCDKNTDNTEHDIIDRLFNTWLGPIGTDSEDRNHVISIGNEQFISGTNFMENYNGPEGVASSCKDIMVNAANPDSGYFALIAHPRYEYIVPLIDLPILRDILHTMPYSKWDDYSSDMPITGMEIWNSEPKDDEDEKNLQGLKDSLAEWKKLLLADRIVYGYAGSDAHGAFNKKFGKAYTGCYTPNSVAQNSIDKNEVSQSLERGTCYFGNNGGLSIELIKQDLAEVRMGETLITKDLEEPFIVRVRKNVTHPCKVKIFFGDLETQTENDGIIERTNSNQLDIRLKELAESFDRQITVTNGGGEVKETEFTVSIPGKYYIRAVCEDSTLENILPWENYYAVYTNPIWIEALQCSPAGSVICGLVDSSTEFGDKNDVFRPNDEIFAKTTLVSDVNRDIKLYAVRTEELIEGRMLSDIQVAGTDSQLMHLTANQTFTNQPLRLWFANNVKPDGSYTIVADLLVDDSNRNGKFDRQDFIDPDSFVVSDIITDVDIDVDPEGNIHAVGLRPDVDSGVGREYTKLMYAKIPHDTNFKIDLEHPELFDWSRARGVEFREIPMTRVKISNPKIAVDMNGEPYIIWERATSGHRWLQWTKLNKTGGIDVKFFYPIKKQNLAQPGQIDPLFEQIFLSNRLDIAAFRDNITIPEGESVPSMPIIFYKSAPFSDFELSEPDIAIDPQDNRPIITAKVEASSPSTTFMNYVYPILGFAMKPFFFIFPSGTFTQTMQQTLENPPPPLYFAESIQVAKLIGTDLGAFSTGWPGDYSAGSIDNRIGQDVRVFGDTTHAIADVIGDMAVPSIQGDEWKWRSIDSASSASDFFMFSNPKIVADGVGNLHITYHKGSIIRLNAPGCPATQPAWDPNNPSHLSDDLSVREQDVCVDNLFSVAMYKKVPIVPAADLPAPFNAIKVHAVGLRPTQASAPDANVKPESIDISADSEGNGHIVWKSSEFVGDELVGKIMYAKVETNPENIIYKEIATTVSPSPPSHLALPKVIVDWKDNPSVLWSDEVGIDEQLLIKSGDSALVFGDALQLATASKLSNPLLAVNRFSKDSTWSSRLHVLWVDSESGRAPLVMMKKTMPHPTVLMVIDGFNSTQFFDNLVSMPNLKELMEQNPTLRGSAITPLPPETFPSQTSLFTAVQPNVHGIVADQFTRPDNEERIYLPDNSHDVNNDLTVQTIFDYLESAGKSKAVLSNIIKKGVGNQPEDKIIGSTFINWNSGDNSAESAIQDYFNVLNTQDLEFGNDPADLIAIYVLKDVHGVNLNTEITPGEVDGVIALLLDSLRQKKMFNDAVFIITSDHGSTQDNETDSIIPLVITGPGVGHFSAQKLIHEIPNSLKITDVGATANYFVGGENIAGGSHTPGLMSGVDGKNFFNPEFLCRVASPVDLHLFDEEGNHVGPVNNGVENQIPTSYYIEDIQANSREIALLQAPEKYRVEINAFDAGPVHLSIKQTAGQKFSIEYPTFLVRKDSYGVVDMIHDDFNLKLDVHNDGVFEENITPTVFVKVTEDEENSTALAEVVRILNDESAEIDAFRSTNSKLTLRAINEITNKNVIIEKHDFLGHPTLFDLSYEIEITFDETLNNDSIISLSLAIPEFLSSEIAKNSLSIYQNVNGTFVMLNSTYDDATKLLTATMTEPGTYVPLATDKKPSITNTTLNPSKTATQTGSIGVSAIVTDNFAVQNVTATFNGNTFEMTPAGNVYSVSLTGPNTTGKYPILIRATDNNGNIAEKTVSYELDDVAPVITIREPENNEFLIRNIFDIQYFVNERSVQSYVLDGISTAINETAAFKTTRIRINNLSAGTHNLSVIATDDVENSRTESIAFTVDSHNIRIFDLNAPLYSKVGETVNIDFVVENTLSFPESIVDIQLIVDNVVQQTQNIALAGQEIRSMSFVLNGVAGRHNVTVAAVPIVNERYLDDNSLGKEVLVTNKIPVLIVDDSQDETSVFRDSVQAANVAGLPGFDYIEWDVDAKGIPDVMDPFKVVIWHTSNETNTLSVSERSVIESYLSVGGRLFINGRNIGKDIGTTGFYQNVLKAEYVSDSSISTVEGNVFHELGRGFLFSLSENGEIIKPLGNAQSAFTYSGDGNAGIASERIVYLPFAFESVPAGTRNDLMSRILEFYNIDIVPPVLSNIKPSYGAVFAINTSAINLTLRTNEIAECYFDGNLFDATNSITHRTLVQNLTNGINRTINIACVDREENAGTGSTSIYVHNRTFTPPVLQQISDINISENDPVVVVANAIDPENDAITYTIEDTEVLGIKHIASRFARVNNTFMLSTNYSDAGEYFLKIKATDQFNSSSVMFKLTIFNVNRPPVLSAIGMQNLLEDQYYTFTVVANDPDNDELAFADDSSFFDIQPYLGIISFTPKNSDVGTYFVNISVSDAESADYETVMFVIENTNDAPVIEFAYPVIAVVGEQFFVDVNASDEDGDNITFTDDSPFFDIDQNGIIDFVPLPEQIGSHIFNIFASDGFVTTERDFNLLIVPEPDFAVTEGQLVNISIDEDNDGIFDFIDNCLGVYNPGQEDLDFDSIGDACDIQTCGNGLVEVVNGTGFGFAEECDDNNTVSGDGCSAQCTIEDAFAPVITNDPVVNITNIPQITLSGTVTDPEPSLGIANFTINSVLVDLVNGAYSYVFTLTEGSNIITEFALDGAGNNATAIKQILLDTQAPVTNSTLIDTDNDGVTDLVVLAAEDIPKAPAVQSSGVREIRYSINSGPSNIIIGSRVNLTLPLLTPAVTLVFYSVDNAGNTEEANTVIFENDACPSIAGRPEYQGCPVGDYNLVELHIIDRLRTFCGGAGSCKRPIEGAYVKVFDRHDPRFLGNYTNNPDSTLYPAIFNSDLALVGTCFTNSTGECIAGEADKGTYFVLVKYYDAQTNKTVYTSKPKGTEDFVDTNNDQVTDFAAKYFQVIKIINQNGRIEFQAGARTIVIGSVLEIIHPEYVVWENNVTSYPFIFTSDSAWTVDVCVYVPAGYEVIGGNCTQEFLENETKEVVFVVRDIGSPEPDASIKLTTTHDGETKNIDLAIPGRRTEAYLKAQEAEKTHKLLWQVLILASLVFIGGIGFYFRQKVRQ